MENQNIHEGPSSQHLTKIQKHIRAKLERIKLKKVIKKLNTRKYVIEQLIDSEENYIRDLGLIVSDFKMKLKTNGILSEEGIIILFSNIDEIRRLHQDFFTILYNHYQDYHPYQVIFADILKNILFFRIYIQYLNNFPTAYNQVKILQKQNSKFAEFLKYVERTPKYKLLRIEDYLVKPVQRLPKYVLLIKEIKKNTMTDHPDYTNICKALQKFEQVNMNNNDKLIRLRDNYKLAQLQSSLILPQGVIGPGVEFVMEESVQILKADGKLLNCTMYLLNNCLLIAKRLKQSQKYELKVPIKHGTSLIYNEDQSYYRNSLTIQGLDGESCTFLCQSQQELQKLGYQLKKQIQKAQITNFSKIQLMFKHNSTTQSFLKRMNIMEMIPDVTALGTSQRNDKLLKYTIYIVQIKVKAIRQKVFLRFSQVLELQQLVKTEFPNLQIKQGIIASGWLRNHYQKTIEQRKMNIQRFLKEVLSKPQIIEGGQKVLLKLGLPVDFYQLPRKFRNTEDLLKKSGLSQKESAKNKSICCRNETRKSNYRLSLFQNNQQSDEEQNYNKSQIKQSFNIHDILKANEIDLGHYTRYSEQLQDQVVDTKLDIFIPCIEQAKGYRTITLKISKYQRIQCLMPVVAKNIGLKYFKDFRLFIQKQFSNRVLDDDELATKVLYEMEIGKCQMKFRKLIHIDNQTQEKQLKYDPVRLSIVGSQVIHEIKKGKYRLSYEKYLRLSVLTGIILNYEKNSKTMSELVKVTRGMILPKYTTLIQSQLIWVNDFEKMYKILAKKLQEVKTKNEEHLKSMIQSFSQEHSLINTSIKNLAYLSIIRQVSNEELFGSVSFAVQVSSELQQYIEENAIEIDKEQAQTHNCWLAIKCDMVYLLSIEMKSKILAIEYEDILKIQPLSNSLILNIKNKLIPYIKLKTVSSYYIRELLLYYKNYNFVYNKMLSGDCSVQEMIEMSHDEESYYQYSVIK